MIVCRSQSEIAKLRRVNQLVGRILAELRRSVAPGVTTQTVNLVMPSSLFGPRVNSVDMRFGKILRFGRTRTNVAIDLYNMFNSNVGTAFNQGFGADGATWLRPTAVLNPRFARFNVTFDF